MYNYYTLKKKLNMIKSIISKFFYWYNHLGTRLNWSVKLYLEPKINLHLQFIFIHNTLT